MIEIELPFPPSLNAYYRHPSRGPLAGRHLISAKGREYRSEVISRIAPLNYSARGRLAVVITCHAPDKRRRDLDNLVKGLNDALTHAGVWEDDSQVKRMLVEWGPVIPEGKVEITISKYEKTAGAAA